MPFVVLLGIGFALGYILVQRPFSNNATITSNILVALTTTLASITAFYFGSRLAAQATAAGATAAGSTGTPQTPLTVTINTPPDQATYTQSATVLADYMCTPSAGAQIVTCNGPVANG